MSRATKILITVVVLAATALSFVIARRSIIHRAGCEHKFVVDTLEVCETVFVEKPVFYEKRKTDTVLISITDTIRIRDTLYMYAVREQVHWSDSLSDIYASGIEVDIDSVKHYMTKQVVTISREVVTKTHPKWGVGIQAGYGIGFSQNITASPYIGIGVTYNIISW